MLSCFGAVIGFCLGSIYLWFCGSRRCTVWRYSGTRILKSPACHDIWPWKHEKHVAWRQHMKALTHQTFLYKNWSTNSCRFGNICCMLECSANNGSLQNSILVVASTMGFKYVFVPASPNDDMQAFFPCSGDMYFCSTQVCFGLLAAWCWSPVCMFPNRIGQSVWCSVAALPYNSYCHIFLIFFN